MCLASCPNPPRPRRRPSSSAVFRVVRAKLPPIAFSMHPSSILANRLDPQPTRTKDDDEDEDEQEEGWDTTLYRYRVSTLGRHPIKRLALKGERSREPNALPMPPIRNGLSAIRGWERSNINLFVIS